MEQDVNKIIDNLSNEWAQDAIKAKRQIAVLVEDKRLLEEKVKELEENKSDNAPTDNAK